MNNPLTDHLKFCDSIIEYAEKIHSDDFKLMAYLLSMEIFLSNPAFYESNFLDVFLLKQDIQRMENKNYSYHLFLEKRTIFNLFKNEKFLAFVTSSSSEAEFNAILGESHSIAVSVQKR